jgi:hypothetical protein
MVLGAVAHASLPYLAVVGPPPLRLEAMVHHGAAAKMAASPVLAAAPNLAATNSPSAPGQPNLSLAATDLGLPATDQIAAAMLSVGPGPDAPPAVGDMLNPTILGMPTPDLLGITPQMLATYFRPTQAGTNAIVGAFPISFTPPVPPPDDKSSHAEYIVK